MFKHILVPIEDAELSRTVVDAACAFAKETGARLTFYHAKPAFVPGYPGLDMGMAGAGYDETLQSAMDDRAAALLSEAARTASAAGVACETATSESDSPHAGIIAAATERDCDLIFMACHGRSGFSALLMGSETQKVLSQCKVPVLVYR